LAVAALAGDASLTAFQQKWETLWAPFGRRPWLRRKCGVTLGKASTTEFGTD